MVRKGSRSFYTRDKNNTKNKALNRVVVKEIGIKEDPSFPGDWFGARVVPAAPGPAATAPPGARPGHYRFQI